MSKLYVLAPLCGLLLAACATIDEAAAKQRPLRRAPDFSQRPDDARSAPATPLPLADAEPNAFDAAREYERRLAIASSAPPALLRIDETDSDYWRSAEFRRRFNESFISEADVEPGYNLIERDVMQQFYELMSTDRSDEALALLQTHRGPAASAALDMNVANLFFSQEKLEEAAAAYEVAVGKHPKFRRAWSNLGLTYFRRNDYPNAIRSLTRAVENGAASALNFGLLGFCYLSSDNSLSAESAYRMAILLDPGTEDWKLGLVRCFFKQRRFADVIALCGEMLAAKPDRADLWQHQANAYIGLNEPLRAAENFEVIDRLGKLDASNLNNLADIYVGQELFDLGVRSYLRAIATDAAVGPARAVRAARVLLSRGAQDEAAELVQGIEAAFPQLEAEPRKELLRLRARMAVARGASDDEARILEEIVELDPLDGDALILLGQHAARGGDVDKAVLYYERAAGIEAFEADAKVRHAQLLVGKGRYSEALVLLRRAQVVKPRENIQKYLEDVERIGQGKGQ